MRVAMTLWYLGPQGAETKRINFASRTDVVSASCMAYLHYPAMKAAARASRICRSHLYVALTGFRADDLPEDLCWGCGWWTGMRHIGLTCNMRNMRDECCSGWDALFCISCVRVDKTMVYCIRCPDNDDGRKSQPLMFQAWAFSCDLNDAITKSGNWHKSKIQPAKYAYHIAYSQI